MHAAKYAIHDTRYVSDKGWSFVNTCFRLDTSESGMGYMLARIMRDICDHDLSMLLLTTLLCSFCRLSESEMVYSLVDLCL